MNTKWPYLPERHFSKKPSEIISQDIIGCFGCFEFELALLQMVKNCYQNGDDWETGFTVATPLFKPLYEDKLLTDPDLFAALCAAGWLLHVWLPRYVFVLSDAFFERIKIKV